MHRILLFGCSILLLMGGLRGPSLKAQTLDFNDQIEIFRKANFMLPRYQSLLRLIGDGRRQNEQARMEKKMEESFDPSNPNRLFLNDKIIIENDLVPLAADPNANRDLQVSEYLRKFNLEYVKASRASVFLEPEAVGNLHEGEKPYLLLLFNRKFTSHHTVYPDVSYEEIPRLLELRPLKIEGVWQLYIASIRYASEEVIAQIQSESAGRLLCGQAIQKADEAVAQRNFLQASELYQYVQNNGCGNADTDEQLSQVNHKLAEYESSLQQGDSLLEVGGLDFAQAYYRQAQAILPQSVEVKERLQTLGKILAEVETETSKGERLVLQGKYQLALNHFEKALLLNPQADALKRRIQEIEFESREEKFNAYIDHADLAYQLRDYNKAQKLYEQALGIKSSDNYAQNQLTQIARIVGPLVTAESVFENGDTDEALKLFRAIAETNPDAPEGKAGMARCYFQKYLDEPNRTRFLSQARQYIDEAIRLAPRYAEAVRISALIYESQQDYTKAIEAYTTLQVFDTSTTANFYKIGQMQELTQDYAAANRSYGKALLSVDDALAARIHLQKGKLYRYHLNKNDSAFYEYGEAIRLDSTYGEPYFLRSMVAMELGDYEDAANYFQKGAARGLHPDSIRTYRNKVDQIFIQARTQFGHLQYQAAINKMEQVVTLDPENAIAWFWKGKSHFANQEKSEAIDCYTRALELNPRYTEAFLFRGQAYKAQPNSEQRAIEDFTAIIRLKDADSTLSYAERGDVYFSLADQTEFASLAQDNYYKALNDYLKALPNYKDKASLEHRLGKLYYHLQKPDFAIEYQTKALKHQGQFPQAYYFRALAYLQTANYRKALDDFKKASQQKEDYGLAKLGEAMSVASYRNHKSLSKGLLLVDEAITLLNTDGYQDEIGTMDLETAQATSSFYRAYIQYTILRLYPKQQKGSISWNRAMGDCELALLRGEKTENLRKEILTLKGMIGLFMGDSLHVKQARNDFKAVIQLDPNHAWAQYGLASCMLVEGQSPQSVIPAMESAFKKGSISWMQINQDPWIARMKYNTSFKALKREYLAPMSGLLGSLLSNLQS